MVVFQEEYISFSFVCWDEVSISSLIQWWQCGWSISFEKIQRKKKSRSQSIWIFDVAMSRLLLVDSVVRESSVSPMLICGWIPWFSLVFLWKVKRWKEQIFSSSIFIVYGGKRKKRMKFRCSNSLMITLKVYYHQRQDDLLPWNSTFDLCRESILL